MEFLSRVLKACRCPSALRMSNASWRGRVFVFPSFIYELFLKKEWFEPSPTHPLCLAIMTGGIQCWLAIHFIGGNRQKVGLIPIWSCLSLRAISDLFRAAFDLWSNKPAFPGLNQMGGRSQESQSSRSISIPFLSSFSCSRFHGG